MVSGRSCLMPSLMVLSSRSYKCLLENLATLTYEKLDQLLMMTEWEEKFSLSTVQALTREMSDHTPLLLNSGEP
jgi:hypothetical protein